MYNAFHCVAFPCLHALTVTIVSEMQKRKIIDVSQNSEDITMTLLHMSPLKVSDNQLKRKFLLMNYFLIYREK